MPVGVLAIGHSHLGAVAEAHNARGGDNGLPYQLTPLQLLRPGIPTAITVNGRIEYPPEVERMVREQLAAVQPKRVALMLEGQQAATVGFAIPAQPWDFLLPHETGPLSLAGDALPYDLVLAIARGYFGQIDRFLARVRPLMGRHVVALSPPPPYGDDAILAQKIALSPDLRDAVMATGLAPAPWRRRIWAVVVEALREIYAAHDIPLLPPPPGAVDQEGFLPFALLSDALHGNMHYGELVLRQLAEWIAEAPR